MLTFATSANAALTNLIVGIVGLFVGVSGFWITLVQLSKVKSVSRAQQEAISNLKFRLAGFDAIQECAQAQIFLDAFREAIQKRDKPNALINYDRLAMCLINISESGYVSDEISSELRSSASRIGILSNGLDSSSSAEWSITKQLETSRVFHALLVKVRFHIHKDQ